MILRVFRVRVQPGKHAEYERFLREEGMPATRAQPGAIDFWVGGPGPSSPDDYVFVSLWRDIEALNAMRGENLDDPGIEPHERDVIKEAWVEHYNAWPVHADEPEERARRD